MQRGLDVGDPSAGGRFEPAALGRLGETLTLDPADDELTAIPAEDLDEHRLAELVEAHADAMGEVPLPVAAGSWTNHATTLLCPGLLAAWTLTDVGLDASPGNLVLHVDGARPVRWRIRDPTRIDRGPEARSRTLSTLVDGTLAPIVTATETVSGLAARVTWTHVGNVAAYLFDRLAELGLEPDPDDRAALLDEEAPPWSQGSNPLAGTVRHEPLPERAPIDAYQVRETCCLKREIPGKPSCASCPRIDVDRRVELIAERRRER